jgi:hypothetical protein
MYASLIGYNTIKDGDFFMEVAGKTRYDLTNIKGILWVWEL